MSYKFEDGKDLIIDAVIDKVYKNIPPKDAALCVPFFTQFLSTVAFDDLREWEIEDLYGAMLNFWAFIYQKKPDETKIRIYNPEFEKDGWQTTHTVGQFITNDMPFLVDSLRMAMNRMGFISHLVIHMGGLCLRRDKKIGKILEVLPRGSANEPGVSVEAPVLMQIDRQTDKAVLKELLSSLERVLQDNRAVVDDWMKMREKVGETIKDLELTNELDKTEKEETIAFLHWIEQDNFTFLGIRDYTLIQEGGDTLLEPLSDTGLGLLRASLNKPSIRNISSMPTEARDLTLSKRILVMSKTTTESTVHRQAYTDYIGVKRFDSKGKVIGERFIIGLYTSVAYNRDPRDVPFLGRKVDLIMEKSGLDPQSHAGKVLLNIIVTLPRDDLIQGNEDELLEIAMGIYYMQERRRIRLFARTDLYRRFVSCLVYVPKERFNSDLRFAMQKILAAYFQADEITFSTWFSESILARIHFMIRTNPENNTVWDFKALEKQLIEVGRAWHDDLQHLLNETFGEETGNNLFARYKNAFPGSYSDSFSARTAVYDIKHIETLSQSEPLVMNFYRSVDEKAEVFHLKIYQHDVTIQLSEVLPIIEHLGMRAISEKPYLLKFDDGKITYINEFVLHYTRPINFSIDEIKELFQQTFINVWSNRAENDGFNQLVLSAGLTWRQVLILRAYAKYFKQIGAAFSQDYIQSSLNNHPLIAKQLVELFDIRFNKDIMGDREQQFNAQLERLSIALEGVSNLDEDRIIRQYMQNIVATVRTNYYQKNAANEYNPYVCLKLNSSLVPKLPKPHPYREIFVYSPHFEGIHLRMGKVARGGIRWSDRPEDFRTEILGLMKAQQVKNAVIVPAGAKGGFVPGRNAEGITSYQSFIGALLDITDNLKEGNIVKPRDVICYDEDDPYLVVAADKGTATFSDIANAISEEHAFWLGDAFASGGSFGYDHKKIGITARGAWESVKRHAYEMELNIETADFTVVGIGDMSGDVFGNGMLLSKHIKLVGAFNHLHIFVDPDPDPLVSFQERQRLFNLPRSSWIDYDRKLISRGGGVFSRSLKSIPVTKEMKQLLGIKQNAIEPNELIRALLKAKVDLLWSAGIGTFVKSSEESHSDVGDRSNIATRVNGRQLRCKMVGEGGNLGFTQLGRVEYALNGGKIYTDSIDNSAGVSCSDKEVNIKILLNAIVASGDLTFKQRNVLLSNMTDEVAQLVLRDNFLQTRAISLIASQGSRHVDLHVRYITALEQAGKIDRAVEFIPDNKIMLERKLTGNSLTPPTIAILLSYSKILLKEAILETNVPEDSYLQVLLINYFPKPLRERFSSQMTHHPLKREIIATKLSNIVVNEMGFSFVFRVQEETGAPVSSIVSAYIIARSVLNMDVLWGKLEAIESTITAASQSEFLMLYVRLLRRTTRWFLRTERMRLNISASIQRYSPGVVELKKAIPSILGEKHLIQYNEYYAQYLNLGLTSELAHELSMTRPLFSAMDIIQVSYQFNCSVTQVAQLYFAIGEYLDLAWIRSQIITHPSENNWEALSREALRDDLDWQQRQLTAGILGLCDNKNDYMASFELWSQTHEHLILRWRDILSNLRSATVLNYTMFFVAIRELLDLTQTTIQMAEKQV